MLVTLYKIGEAHFRLLGTNGFRVKAKNERFTAASSRCRQNLKYETLTSLFGRLKAWLNYKTLLRDKLFLVMFPEVAKLGKICFGRKICVREAKMFLTPGKNIFCFPSSKICFRNIVS